MKGSFKALKASERSIGRYEPPVGKHVLKKTDRESNEATCFCKIK